MKASLTPQDRYLCGDLPMSKCCIHPVQLFLNVSKMSCFLMKHDLQVNNVASEICTEYGTQGIQKSE